MSAEIGDVGIDQTSFESVFDLPDAEPIEDSIPSDEGTSNPTGETESETVAEADKGKTQTDETPDEFSFVKAGKDGEESFDAEAAMKFATGDGEDRSIFSYDGHKEPPKTPQAAVAAGQPQQTAEETQATYEETLSQNLMAGFSILDKYIAAGYDANTALALSRKDVETQMREHLRDRQIEEMRQENTTARQKLLEEAERKEAGPKSTANLAELSKSYGGIDKLQKMLFDRSYGGEALLMLFDLDNPNNKSLVGDELRDSMKDWFKTFASNKQNLQLVEEFARARIIVKTLPKIIEHARGMKVATDKVNARGDKMPPSNIHSEPKGDQKPDPLARYTEGFDRV